MNVHDLAGRQRRVLPASLDLERQDFPDERQKRRRILPRLLDEIRLTPYLSQRSQDQIFQLPRELVLTAALAADAGGRWADALVEPLRWCHSSSPQRSVAYRWAFRVSVAY